MFKNFNKEVPSYLLENIRLVREHHAYITRSSVHNFILPGVNTFVVPAKTRFIIQGPDYGILCQVNLRASQHYLILSNVSNSIYWTK